jgi:hypothetical protein
MRTSEPHAGSGKAVEICKFRGGAAEGAAVTVAELI